MADRAEAILEQADKARALASQTDDLMQEAAYLRAAHTFEEEYRLLIRSQKQEQA
jgi:hypothetical protein